MSTEAASVHAPSLYARLSAIHELDRVVEWATRRVTIHPAFADDLRQEILIELTRVQVAADDPVKLGSTVASRVSLKFKAQHHGPIKFRDCTSANRARRGAIELAADDSDDVDPLILDLLERYAPADDLHEEDQPLDPTRLTRVFDSLSPALYRVARHIARGENIAFIAAAEQMTEASVRTVIHRIHHAVEDQLHADRTD